MKRIKISLFKGKDYDVLITKHSKNLISIIIYVVNYVLVPQPLICKGSMTYKLLGISLVLFAYCITYWPAKTLFHKVNVIYL